MYGRVFSFRACFLVAFVAASSTFPQVASAGGFEMTPLGARANGRGGSEFASGDSAMSLFYNPAGLVLVQAPVSIDGSFQVHFNRRCYEGVAVDESGATPTAGATYPEICGETGFTLLPELAGTVRVRDDLVLGFGLQVPTAGARHIAFGDVETGQFDPDGAGPMAAVDAPTRYQLMESDLLQLFLTVGASYAPHPRFRLGGSFGWGITKVSFSNAAYARLDVVPGLITAFADARSSLDGLDAFVPPRVARRIRRADRERPADIRRVVPVDRRRPHGQRDARRARTLDALRARSGGRPRR